MRQTGLASCQAAHHRGSVLPANRYGLCLTVQRALRSDIIIVYHTVPRICLLCCYLARSQQHVAIHKNNTELWGVENAVWLLKTLMYTTCVTPNWRNMRAQMAYLQELVPMQVQVQVLVQLLASFLEQVHWLLRQAGMGWWRCRCMAHWPSHS